jgi:hypothetical protein
MILEDLQLLDQSLPRMKAPPISLRLSTTCSRPSSQHISRGSTTTITWWVTIPHLITSKTTLKHKIRTPKSAKITKLPTSSNEMRTQFIQVYIKTLKVARGRRSTISSTSTRRRRQPNRTSSAMTRTTTKQAMALEDSYLASTQKVDDKSKKWRVRGSDNRAWTR